MSNLKKFIHDSVSIINYSLLVSVLLGAPAKVLADTRIGLDIGPSEKTAADYQQQKKGFVVSGVVSDDLGPVAGVNIVVKGTLNGITTDADGKFILTVADPKSVLVVSYIGYASKEVPIDGKRQLIIRLQENTQNLEEVVVVGYGVQKKESVVGAITQVDNTKLMRAGTSNITNAIAGKLSGVLTMQQTGQPGSNDSEIIIRGLSSWNGSEPLVLVDGVERDFKDLDPNEINTISVLKDASATAVFGAKGANGVIIVTTKRGQEGKPKLDFSASYGMQHATRIPDHIDSYTTMSMYNVGLMNNGKFQDLMPESVLQEYKNPSTRLNSLRYPNVDWFGLLTKSFSPVVNANFNLVGGTSFVKYFCSLGYLHEGTLFDSFHQGYADTRYSFNKFNYRTNLDFNLTKTTVLSLNVGGDIGIKNAPKDAPWRNMYSTSPARYPAYFPAWVLEEVPDVDYPDASGDRLAASFGEYTGNPYTTLHQGKFDEFTESKLFTDLILDQKLDFITKGLSVKAKVALSTYYKNKSLTADWNFPQYRLDYDLIGTGQNPWYREGQGNETWVQPPLDINVGALEGGYYNDLYYEAALNYQRTFGNHGVSALALMNRQQKNKETDFAYYNESWVGRLTYDFSHRYLVEVNLGYTGSERFAPSKRFGFFPSGAVGWVISEEKFFKEAFPWMNKLKLRYSDGKVGSDKASERWLYMSDYSKDNSGYIHQDNTANFYAQWEEARKRDIGVEVGVLNNLVTLGLDFFDEKREKMLLDPRSTTMFIGNGFKQLNLGSLKKHGVEVELEFNKTTAYGMNYYLKGVFAYNDNRILFKDDLPYAPDYTKEAGKPLGAQNSGVILTGSGYYTSIDDIHNNPSPIAPDQLNVGDYKFLDYSVDGQINTLDKYPIKGSLFPPITFSFSGGFAYRNFEFSFLFQGNSGKYVDFNQTYEVEFCKGDWRVHQSQLDYWTPTNPDANHSTLHFTGTGDAMLLSWGGGEADRGYGIKVQDRFWRNADYIRLKEVYLGYTIKSKFLNKLAGVSNLILYASGNNLFTITDLIEGDPERKDFQQGFYPQLTTYKLGLKVAF